MLYFEMKVGRIVFNIVGKFTSIRFIINVIGWCLVTVLSLSFSFLKTKDNSSSPYMPEDGNSENIRAINYK